MSYFLPQARTNYGKFNIRFTGVKNLEFNRWSAENSQKVSFQKESKRQSGSVKHNLIIILHKSV